MPRATIFFVLAFSLTVSAQVVAPFVPPNAIPSNLWAIDRNLLWGRLDNWEGAPDFFCRQSETHSNVIHPLADGTPKCYSKGMVLGDIGDAPDLVLRRAGPDGAAYNARPQPVRQGTSLGTLYWQAWGERCERRMYGFWSGCGGNGRTAQIYSRTAGEQTGNSRAGSLHLATTPLGNSGDPIDRFVISSEGRIILQTLVGMREVEVGSEDSCGTGYRCLRVTN